QRDRRAIRSAAAAAFAWHARAGDSARGEQTMTMPSIHALLVVVHRPSPSVRPVELATAAVLTVLAVTLRWAPSGTHRTRGLQEAAMASARWASHASRPTLRQILGAAFGACAVGLFIGGAGGVIAGVMTGVGLLVFGSRRVSENEMRARQRLIAAAPPAVDLFAAALAAGLLPADAASVVATAFHGGDESLEAAKREHPTSRSSRYARSPRASQPQPGRCGRARSPRSPGASFPSM